VIWLKLRMALDKVKALKGRLVVFNPPDVILLICFTNRDFIIPLHYALKSVTVEGEIDVADF
jgi:hypothetical protein